MVIIRDSLERLFDMPFYFFILSLLFSCLWDMWLLFSLRSFFPIDYKCCIVHLLVLV